jgi:hypothetical protein
MRKSPLKLSILFCSLRVAAITEIEDFNTRIERIRTVIQALPRHNFDLLKRVVEHLDK